MSLESRAYDPSEEVPFGLADCPDRPVHRRTLLVHPRYFDVRSLESIDGLACNCRSIDGETVVIGAGNPRTTELLETAGYGVHEIATDEFLKAGGSVRCLTLTLT